MINPQKTQLYFFFLLFAAIAVVCFFIFLPYLGIIILSLSLAVAIEPWHKHILNFCGGHRGLAAFLTMIIIILVILAPLTFVGLQVFNESKNIYTYIDTNQALVIETMVHRVQSIWPGFNFQPNVYLQQFVDAITNNLTTIFSSTLSTLLQIVLGFFSLFFFLRDGDFFLKSLTLASPLDNKYDEKIILKLKGAINTVVRGNLFLGIIQGLVASLGFTIFGLPNPALWGSVAALCSFVPTVGTSLVTIPAIIYLFFAGNSLHALGLMIWVIIIVSLIDNLLAPFVMGRGTKIHPLFLLFSIIGGVTLFGPIGVLMGPLTVSFFFALLNIYRLLIADKKQKSVIDL